MKKILFILPNTQQGGAETQLLCLLRGLDKSKFDVYLGLLYENEQLKKEFTSIKNVKTICFNKRGPWDVSVLFKIKRFIRENDIEIVQTFLGNHYSFIPVLFSKKIIAVGGIRATEQPENISFLKRIITYKLPKIISKYNKSILVSNSYSGKRLFVKEDFPEKLIEVIPNGIDFNRFSKGNGNKIIKEFNLKNKFVFAMVSRLVEGKNHPELIQVFKKLTDKRRNLILLIIGAGPEMDKLKQLVKELGLDTKVIFTGNRKDIPDFLAAVDIYLFPSRFPEGWPNAVGEAMAAGVPVITYQIGDVKQIIKSGYNGIITDNNMKSFYDATIELMKKKNKMKLLGINAQKTIEQNYSVDKMVRNYQNLYFRLLKTEKKNNTAR
jgi:glycosyltransferase involved in cell wall biosynthesis